MTGAWADEIDDRIARAEARADAAEVALAALRERIEAAASSYAASRMRERAYALEQLRIGRNDLATEACRRGDADAAAARTIRALLDSPDAGAKGEVR
jgi:hypothetical protein